MMKKLFSLLAALVVAAVVQAAVKDVRWDRHSLIIDGERVCPVMGEVHYSRIPAAEWQEEVKKMKDGGITLIACYVFWNHIEELENQFDWSGQRNLRAFLEVCQQEELPVVLRMGPFCHGEVRNGGIPDWVVASGCKLRSEDPVFLGFTERLYRQIFTQVQGLQWKDGGPVIAAQFDNEYGGHGSYLLALKRIALRVGFDLPFYTRTGWPELASPVPFGEMIPLYGDYADGFWDRSTKEGAGSYYKAFNFHAFRGSKAIASEQLKQDGQEDKNDQAYPYFTCELGGGMMTSYHRRIFTYPEDAYSMAVVKLGSGSNLLGYYMYHGGTNPEGKTGYLNETQRCLVTNYNDLPVKTYDFQAPLGEFGQTYPHYYMLRPLHLFMKDFATVLAPMEASFPCAQEIQKGSDEFLRWSYRTDGRLAFIFVNNYERFHTLSTKKGVQLEACGVRLPKLTIPSGAMAIFPVKVAGMDYATAQIVAQRDGKLYLEQVPGIPVHIRFADGKSMKNVKPLGTERPIYKNVYLLAREQAERLFLSASEKVEQGRVIACEKKREAGDWRVITIGDKKVAEEPTDRDFTQAASYHINLGEKWNESVPASARQLLSITYRGDCARLYAFVPNADGTVTRVFIDDNFYNGRPFLYGLWRLPAGCTRLELRILPIQPDMPVYFPKEADTTLGEAVLKVETLSLSWQ